MSLDADCTTDETIFVMDGYTLDGQGFEITAVDPGGGHFLGGVVENEGAVAHVIDLVVSASGLSNSCDGGGDRLRGIMFEGASGSIRHSTVVGINQGASGCQEGNAIEIRNAPFDGTGVDPVFVEMEHNFVDSYQKGGIIANGNVHVSIHNNVVGASATQQNLAANAVQLGFGAEGIVELNQIAGNQWLGASNFSATAVLLFGSATFPPEDPLDSEIIVRRNNLGGNADVGIFVIGNGAFVDNNRVFESGVDGDHGDFGIAEFGDSMFSNNKIRGYVYPIFGDADDARVIPSPQDPTACFQACN